MAVHAASQRFDRIAEGVAVLLHVGEQGVEIVRFLKLLLSRNRDATVDEIREALVHGGLADAATGLVPNNSWGAGKLNVTAAIEWLRGNRRAREVASGGKASKAPGKRRQASGRKKAVHLAHEKALQLIDAYERPPMDPGGSLRLDVQGGDRSAGASYFFPD